ncbi:hypothetical protein UFOVP639_27 [uncultured Caudovirales phage]|uniref:Uncharacterized protein n=1 Tax=uncultured Caudovirales phage TaxID=2100421 RepID=A0A6J5N4P3_9CAUD|nr:hypothetical protein UFOVP639_27 [uncultured Caudovirales phage]
MTEEEFFEKNGQTLHIRLLIYYNEYASEEEKENQEDTDILFFEMEEGRYSIRYGDLKRRADEETIAYIENNGGDIKDILKNED